MKVQCEVCSCADEAALCDGCDRRVHRANRLAGRHQRLSTPRLPANPHLFAKEKRGFVFCQEDRTILCRDCDVTAHSATTIAMKHSRFLLTGVCLSDSPMLFTSSVEAETTTAGRTHGSMAEITTAAWHVEDLLMDDAAAHAAIYKMEEEINPLYIIDSSNLVLNGLGGALPDTLPQLPDSASREEGFELELMVMAASQQ